MDKPTRQKINRETELTDVTTQVDSTEEGIVSPELELQILVRFQVGFTLR